MGQKVNDLELLTMRLEKGATITVDANKYKNMLVTANMKALLDSEFRELKKENERLKIEVNRLKAEVYELKSRLLNESDFIHIDVCA